MSNDSFAFLQKDLASNELNALINLHLAPHLEEASKTKRQHNVWI
jgi:hypothetical protein